MQETRQNRAEEIPEGESMRVEVIDVRYSVECHVRGVVAKNLSRREADALAKLNAGATLYAHL